MPFSCAAWFLDSAAQFSDCFSTPALASSPVLLLATFRWLSVGSLPKPSRSVRAVLVGAVIKSLPQRSPTRPSPWPPFQSIFLRPSSKKPRNKRNRGLLPPPILIPLLTDPMGHHPQATILQSRLLPASRA